MPAQIHVVTLGQVTHHAGTVGVVRGQPAAGQSRQHVRAAGTAGRFAACIRQRERSGLVRQGDIRAAAILGEEALHRRGKLGWRRIDRAVVECDAELLCERAMNLRRQAVADRMAEYGELGGLHADSL